MCCKSLDGPLEKPNPIIFSTGSNTHSTAKIYTLMRCSISLDNLIGRTLGKLPRTRRSISPDDLNV